MHQLRTASRKCRYNLRKMPQVQADVFLPEPCAPPRTSNRERTEGD